MAQCHTSSVRERGSPTSSGEKTGPLGEGALPEAEHELQIRRAGRLLIVACRGLGNFNLFLGIADDFGQGAIGGLPNPILFGQ